MAVTFLMLSVILAFEDFGSPLVRRKIVTEEHRRTAQTVSVELRDTAAAGSPAGRPAAASRSPR
ncbi:hypothetical protein AB0L40_11785 [Patulibacter sp. NPDC049589]|uniref:hypothetical protein n=1 Tax=Patulibacter sp. NPDC049589 TaxID=3154731 RepID=UPI003417234E